MSANAPPITVWGIITDFLATNPTPQEIIEFRLPEELEARTHYLLERNREDEITSVEHKEMFDFVRIDKMMSLLKIKMRIRLKNEDE